MSPELRAICFLSAVGGALFGWCVFRFLRRPYSPLQWALYYLNQFLVRFMWRANLPQNFPVPKGQGAIVICNHRSSVDPCFIQAVAKRRLVHWMVAELYPPKSLIGRLLQVPEFIPIRQHGSDTSALKRAIRIAKGGGLVGILPEGHINTTDEFMLKVRPGAVVIALMAGVPILPCYLEGSPFSDLLWWPVFMRANVCLKFGPLMDLSEYEGCERDPEVVATLMGRAIDEIAKLAGVEHHQMKLAGRQWKNWTAYH